MKKVEQALDAVETPSHLNIVWFGCDGDLAGYRQQQNAPESPPLIEVGSSTRPTTSAGIFDSRSRRCFRGHMLGSCSPVVSQVELAQKTGWLNARWSRVAAPQMWKEMSRVPRCLCWCRGEAQQRRPWGTWFLSANNKIL